MLFNKEGILNLDEIVAERPSFKKIMEDGYVSEQELSEQSDKVLKLLKQIETELTTAQQELVKEVLVEVNVMNAAFQQYQIQNIH
ncbi:MAG: hypothetical protein KBT06_02810 [Prevotellaceae bacterium]|nr:hypothetical protein [Candidatus Colivivens equi]